MAGLNPLPTFVVHDSTRLTHREAHSFLSTFLSEAEIRPGYRPDSTLTESGPQAVSSGANPNLTLHHLKRILLGMEGKKVGGSDLAQQGDGEVDEGEEEHYGARNQKGTGRKRPFEDGEALVDRSSRRKVYDAEDDAAAEDAKESSDWQDKDDYELAQTDRELDLTAEDRHPGADLDQPHGDEDEEALVNVEIEKTGKKVDPRKQVQGNPSQNSPSEKKLDKEERKRLKKLRLKEEKQQRAKTRGKETED